MRNSLYAILVAAAGLGMALPLTTVPASATPACQSATDVGCDMPAGAYFGPSAPTQSSQMAAKHHVVARHVVVRHEPNVQPLAVPTIGRTNQDNPCHNVNGGGSGTPAYLY